MRASVVGDYDELIGRRDAANSNKPCGLGAFRSEKSAAQSIHAGTSYGKRFYVGLREDKPADQVRREG